MFVKNIVLIIITLFVLIFPILGFIESNSNSEGNSAKPANASPAATAAPVNGQASPANTQSNPANTQTTPSGTQTTPANPPGNSPGGQNSSAITRIPSSDGRAEIMFLGTNETDKNKLSLKVRFQDEKDSQPQKKTFLVTSTELRSQLAKFKEGDQVLLEYAKDKDGETLRDVEVRSVQTNGVWSSLFIVLFPLLGLFFGRKLILGEDNFYSKSKFQIVIWFFVLVGVYLAVNILRVQFAGWEFAGGVGIPTNLLLLAGLSSISFVGAKAITESKVENKPQTKPINPGQPNFFRDLAYGDYVEKKIITEAVVKDANGDPVLDASGQPTRTLVSETVLVRSIDLADFQMIVITLLAVVVYIVQAMTFAANIELHQFVTLPDVDSTILAAFGLGQGAYLVKKYNS